ncbi:T9SS type A sorting domain-containing protein [Chryseobacterium sp. Tr-659]|uniref:T9SS type A sorting domain-containing protein n=1 Tax=Chryseobacterium sp. Tr-659 TaxID=2608340 RepID=UPI00141DC724|nr:T9SS type A sorting domain-containing protein [Chryseobacterium sp. Tr-659]NIF06422.1 T9SS type A sorting domain-containing protein [Chryseobacterium sp. Tr-659]
MKIRFFFWLLLLPVMSYCQYYVGREQAYPISEFYSSLNFKGAIGADGSTYMYYGSSNLKKVTIMGTPYPGFGTNGVIDNVIPITNNSNSISVNDQNIYLSSNDKIAKYDLGGLPDLSFGVNGVVTFPQNVYSISVNPDSSLFFRTNGQIRKLLSNGQIDNSFVINTGQQFIVSDNNIYVFNYYPNNNPSGPSYGYMITKYDFNGMQDTQYGNVGSLDVSNFTFALDHVNGNLYLQPSTGIIKKYTSAGVLDNAFGIGGTIQGDFPPGGSKVITDSNNNILFFGGGQAYGYNATVIFRLKSNGEPDNTFNNGSYKYTSADAVIRVVRLIDDNTFVCLDSRRYSLNSTTDRVNKYIRTLNPSELALNVKNVDNMSVDNIQLYPNPTSDFINIQVSKNEKINKVNIFTVAGDFIFSSNKSKIDIEHLTTGSYIIEVITNNTTYKSRFIKK